MTDNFNVASGQDPQSKNIRKQDAIGKGDNTALFAEMFADDTPDPNELRTDKPEPKAKAKKGAVMTVTEAYRAGLEMFELMGYTVRLDPNGPFCGHTILKRRRPDNIFGIIYPAHFQPLLPIHPAEDDVDKLVSRAKNHTDDTVRELWGDTLDKRFNIDMERVARSEMLRASQLESFTELEPLTLHRSFDPDGTVTESKNQAHDPETWIPARAWFAPQLQQVTFQDVFSIFPDAERELLKLLLGRACLGPTDQIPHGEDEAIRHGARMAGIVVGEPGAGKSTLFERALLPALAKCGYKRGNFQDVSGRFGLAEVALSDLAYKDDTTKETLRKLMSSEQAKTMISSGQLNTEEKNQKAVNVRANTVLLLCANDWNPRAVYDLDGGIVDRFKVLRTLSRPELERLQQGKNVNGVTPISELSRKSGMTLNPGTHLDYLCEELNVSREALLLWCCRLATDEFYDVAIKQNKNCQGKDLLEMRVRELTSKCRIQFHLDVTKTLVMAMVFCSFLRNPDWQMPSLTGKGTLALALRDFYFVMTDQSCGTTLERMNHRWLDENRNPIHYYDGIRRVNVPTIKLASNSCEEVWGDNRSLKKSFKFILEKLELRDGFAMNAEISEWTGRWNLLRLERADDLREEAILMREQMTASELARVDNFELSPTDDWTYNPNYTPELAQHQRPMMTVG